MAPRAAVIELVVSDMSATLAFYRRLGVDVPAGADTEAHVDTDLGELKLAFDTTEVIRSFDPEWSPPDPTGGHRVALGFECENPATVDSTWADMTGAGFTGHLQPWDAFWGQRYAVLHDPDGTPVDLFAPLPG